MGSVVHYPTGTGAVVVGGRVVARVTKINIAVASDDGGKVRIKTRRDRIGLGNGGAGDLCTDRADAPDA
jgi:hypothetical protein